MLRGQLQIGPHRIIQRAVTAKADVGEEIPGPGTTRAYPAIIPGPGEHSPEEETEHSLHGLVEDTETWDVLGRGNGIRGQYALVGDLVAVVKSFCHLARQEFSILLRVLLVLPTSRDAMLGGRGLTSVDNRNTARLLKDEAVDGP